MTSDFDKYQLPAFITETSPGKYPSKEDMEHLTYLDKRTPFFKREEEDKFRERRLVCASCGHVVTRVSEAIEVRGRHHHDFPYFGNIVRLGCYRSAPGCVGVERISDGYSWFRGYSWQIQLCGNCYTQLGWKYMSLKDSFYGLVFKLLREEKAEGAAGVPVPSPRQDGDLSGSH